MSDHLERLKAWRAFSSQNRPGYDHMRDVSYNKAPVCDADVDALLAEVEKLRADKLNTDAFLMLALHRYGSMTFSENDVRRAAEWWNAVQMQAEAAAEQQPEDGDRG